MNTTQEPHRAIPQILIVSDKASQLSEIIRGRFPNPEISCCLSYDEFVKIGRETKPEIVLSYRFEHCAYPRDVLFGMPSVRWVHVGGAGVDHLIPWDPKKVVVTNSSGLAAKVMSEYVLGMVLALYQHLPNFFHQQLKCLWEYRTIESVSGKIMAIIGTGHIGQSVSAKARAFGMHTIGVRLHPKPLASFDEVVGQNHLHDALAKADVVVVAVPRTPKTLGLIDERAFHSMKPGSLLINVSRGRIVDEMALCRALRNQRLAGGALDVFATEPLPADSPLWDLPNVIITPHISGEYEGWEKDSVEFFCENLNRWINDRTLLNRVDPVRGY